VIDVSRPDLADLGATQLADQLRSGALSATQLAEAVCARIEATEPVLHAFIAFDRDGFLTAAIETDQARQTAGGAARVPGLPVAVKDNLDVAGQRTTAGSRVLGHSGRLAADDAGAVSRVRHAGGLIVGKTNLHEFAYGATGVNPRHGTPRNPWDLTRVPGGSSSGSAVAVAALQVPLAVGTDAAGSIRMPASLCGVVGLKPTFGRVSTRGLLASHNATLDHVGPLARNVADAALGLQILAGFDPADSTSIDEPVPDYVAALDERDSLRGLRVGIPSSYFFQHVDPAVESGVRTAIDVLGQLGAELVGLDIPDLDDMMSARLALFADGLAFHLPHLRSHPELYTREIRQRLCVDAFVQAHDYSRASRVRRLLRERFARAFVDSRVDVIATPTTPIAAVPAEQLSVTSGEGPPEPVGLAMLRLTAPANLTGLPAISVPAGFVQTRVSELPFGLQLMARPFQEPLLLRAAHLFEQSTPWHKRRPPDLDA
jgi:aspartyl-tRNA(Asn)/glutamyl-tRNA(Gln) amidotransferase subunit A